MPEEIAKADPENVSDLPPPAVVPDLPPVNGRALVDIPRLDLRCGQYGSVPAADLDALVASGEFDPAA